MGVVLSYSRKLLPLLFFLLIIQGLLSTPIERFSNLDTKIITWSMAALYEDICKLEAAGCLGSERTTNNGL